MEETFLPFPSPFSPLQKRSRPVSFHGLEHFFFCFSVTDFRREFFRFCSLFFGSRPTEFSVVFFLPPLYQVATFHFDEMKILVLVLFLFNVEAILEKTKKNVGHRKAGGYEATKKNPKEFITATFSAKTTRQTKNPKPFLGKKKRNNNCGFKGRNLRQPVPPISTSKNPIVFFFFILFFRGRRVDHCDILFGFWWGSAGTKKSFQATRHLPIFFFFFFYFHL